MFNKISLVIVSLFSTFVLANDAIDTIEMAKMYEKMAISKMQ